MNSENVKNINQVGKYDKNKGKIGEKIFFFPLFILFFKQTIHLRPVWKRFYDFQ